MVRALAIAFVLVLVDPAYAGFGCDDSSSIQDIEVYANARRGGDPVHQTSGSSWLCLAIGAERVKPRIEKACKRILDRDGEPNNPCIVVAAAAGFGKLGAHDIFALVGKIEEDPLEYAGGIELSKADLYARLGDPRGAQVLTEMWTRMIPRAELREKRHRSMTEWSAWRQNAAKALGALGDADTERFLQDQANATKDRFVRDACTAAAAAIAKRLTPR